MATVLACSTCGRSEEEGGARFCGGCGALLRRREESTAAVPSPGPAPEEVAVEAVTERPWRRRAFATVVLALLAVLGVTLAAREPDEVVTADGLGTWSGRTSNVAVTELSTQHWTVDLRPAPGEPTIGWIRDAARDGDILVLAGQHTTVLDLARGRIVSELPTIEGTPVLRHGRLHAVVRDLLLEVEADDGTIRRAVRLDREVSSRLRFPVPVAEGHLVVADGRVSLVAADGTVRWSTRPRLELGELATAVAADAVVLTDHQQLVVLDLADGEARWRTERRLEGNRGPARGPMVVDGKVLSVEPHARSGDAGFPVSGVVTARDLATGDVVWQAVEPVAANLLGVRDGIAFVASELDADITRLDARTGEARSRLRVDGPSSPPGVAALGPSGLLLLLGPEGGLIAVDDATGAERWRSLDMDPWSAHVVDDLLVAGGAAGVRVIAADGRTVAGVSGSTSAYHTGIAISGAAAMVAPGLAVDLVDGSVRIDDPSVERWSRSVAVPGGFVVQSPSGARILDGNGAERWSLFDAAGGGWKEPVAVVDGKLLVAGPDEDGGALTLLDGDGRRIGEPLRGRPLYGAVVVGDLVVGHGFGRGPRSSYLTGVRVAADGLEELWTATAAGGPVLADATGLYEVTGATVSRRDLVDGGVVTTVALPRVVDPRRVALTDGTLFAGHGDLLVAFDARTGEERWARELGDEVTAGPRVADEVVYVGTAGGEVTLFRSDGTPLTVRDVADEPVRDLVAARGLLLVVTDRRASAFGPAALPGRTTWQEPREVGTVNVPVP